MFISPPINNPVVNCYWPITDHELPPPVLYMYMYLRGCSKFVKNAGLSSRLRRLNGSHMMEVTTYLNIQSTYRVLCMTLLLEKTVKNSKYQARIKKYLGDQKFP